jgi:integration host factor subunit alpha
MAEAGSLTRAELADSMHKQIGLSRAECATIVEAILGRMTDALARGEQVKITGFGTFMVREKVARMGRNPKTLQEVVIPARRVLSFRPSQGMRDRIERS